MTSIRVGCFGFPLSRKVYFQQFSVAEVKDTFQAPLRAETAERWSKEAREDFEFIMVAWQRITHEPDYRDYQNRDTPEISAQYGLFKSTEAVRQAWAQMLANAELLKASKILFFTPSTFTPAKNNRENLKRFLAETERGEREFIWEARGPWEEEAFLSFSQELDIIPALDPLLIEPPGGRLAYFRLRGPTAARYRYDEYDLMRVIEYAERYDDAYIIFNTPEMLRDAKRMSNLVALKG